MDQATLSIGLLGGLTILLSLTFHEFCHGLAAYLQGDTTAQREGRLTLNPIAHLDLWGTLIPILLVVTGSPFVIGWAKPVPYNPWELKNPRWGSLLVALAGPISNIFLALVSGIVLNMMIPRLEVDNLLIVFLVLMVLTNVGLGFFNLIPIPPLDGSKILAAILPQRFSNVLYMLDRYGPIFLIIFVVFLYPWISPYLKIGLCGLMSLLGGPAGALLGCH